MKQKYFFILGLSILILAAAHWHPDPAKATERLRYSSSAQVYAVLSEEILAEFTRQSGIPIDLFVGSSEAALYRIYNHECELASTAERIIFPKGDYGFVDTPLFKVPMVVISHPQNGVDTLTEDQLRDIFCGRVSSWKAVGGPDRNIVVVIPDKNTAAFRNFFALALKRSDIHYDILTYQSTMVVQAVSAIAGSVSFVTVGTPSRNPGLTIIKVNGLAYSDKDYPYFQNFSLVTRGRPRGATKAFIDYVSTDNIQAAIRAEGCVP